MCSRPRHRRRVARAGSFGTTHPALKTGASSPLPPLNPARDGGLLERASLSYRRPLALPLSFAHPLDAGSARNRTCAWPRGLKREAASRDGMATWQRRPRRLA